MMKKLLFLAITLFSIQGVMAQLTLDGEFRTRGEYRDGYMSIPHDAVEGTDVSGTLPMGIILQRSRLSVNYKTDKLQSKLTVQDARIWGEDKFRLDNSGVGLYEAWVKYNITSKLGLQVGRMELKYDDDRLFCNGNWRTPGQSNDMARLTYFAKGLSLNIHAGYAVNNNSTDEITPFQSEYGLNGKQYKNLSYLWINKTFLKKRIELSLIGVRDGFQHTSKVDGNFVYDPTQIHYRITTGAYMKLNMGMLGLQGAYYQQLGEDKFGKTLNANFYNALLSVKVGDAVTISAGYDHYSGTNLNEGTENNTFENLVGPGHKYLGWMDYFGSVGKHKAGVNDILAKVDFKFNQKNKLTAFYHMFSLDQEYLNYTEPASGVSSVEMVDKNLGSEIDFMYTYKPQQNLSFNVGYSVMLYTESMETLKGIVPGTGNFAHFGYVQMTYKPQFFKYSSKSKSRATSSSRSSGITKPKGRAATKAKKSDNLEGGKSDKSGK